MPQQPHFVDLSHTIEPGMPMYPGMPEPVVTTEVSRRQSARQLADGVSFHIAAVRLAANTGTYLDAPFHYHADGADVAGLALSRLVDLPTTLVRAGEGRAIGARHLPEPRALTRRAVLVHTGHARHWGTGEYFRDAPYLTEEAVERLIASDVRLVGIDSMNIDNVDDPRRPAHNRLLGAGIPIVEHLTALDRLPDDGTIRLTVLPAPVRGMGSFPVRAVAHLGDTAVPDAGA